MAINIKNQFYRLIKLIIRYIKIWRFIFVVVFIVFLMLLGLLTANYLQGGKMAVISSPVGKIFLSPYRLLRKSSNFLYLGYELKNHDLPTYKLIIDPKDLKFLNNNLPEPFVGNRLTDEYRRRVPAIFYYQDHEYKVEVSYRGWVSNHWGNAKKSWDIKFDKDNPFKGLSGLNLIIPEDRGIGLEYYNNYRAKKLGLYPLFSSFIVLEINGRNNGMYFAVEPWDENYLAKHELIDDVDMFAFDEDRHRYDRDMDIFEDVQYFSKKESNSLYQNKDYSLVIKLVDLINNSDDEEFKKEIVKILDIDNFLTWQAHYILSSSVHNDLSNIRFFIDRSTGKIIFVPWDVNMREPDQNLEKSMFSLYSRITMIPEFAHKRNKILWNYVNNEDNLKDDLEFYDNTFNQVKVALAQDHLKLNSTRWFFKENDRLRQQIIDNFNNVKSVLGGGRAAIIIHTQKNTPVYFDITADVFPDIKLNKIELHIKDDKNINVRLIFDSNFNNKLDITDQVIGYSENDDGNQIINPDEIIMSPRREYFQGNDFLYFPKKYRFFITSNDNSILTDIKLMVVNAITNKKVDEKIQYINDDRYRYLRLKNLSIDDFLKTNPIFKKVEENKIVLPVGEYVIYQDIIIPENIELIIYAGTNIRLMPEISIISYGSIQALGTDFSPINFRGVVEKIPWGVLAISGSTRVNNLQHVKFSGGGDAHINGVYYSGMLSAYHSDITIDNAIFESANADDALNIKSATASVYNSTFISNSADAIDFDFIKEGEIIDNKFINNGNDSIDISGSEILISDNYIENSGDKCISVGEKSIGTIIYNNVLNKCAIGVEIKDLSNISIINNVIVENSIGINAYSKKQIFGGGQAGVYNSIFENNEVDIETDEDSRVVVRNSNLRDLGGQNNNFDAEPVFNHDFTNSSKNGNILFVEGGDSSILKSILNIELDQVSVGLNK